MYNNLLKMKTGSFKHSGINIKNLSGFFTPFQSFSDARRQVKSPLLMPLIDLGIVLRSSISILGEIGEMAVNLATADFRRIGSNLLNVYQQLAVSVYFTVSILTDTLLSLTALATRTLVTMGSGVVSSVQCAVSGCSSERDNTVCRV